MENKIKHIKEILSSMNIPIAYHHFNEPVQTPYIAFYEDTSENTFADNKVYYETSTIDIELYTDKKDVALEEQIKNLLNQNEIPYEKTSETYISEEKLYEITYEIII